MKINKFGIIGYLGIVVALVSSSLRGSGKGELADSVDQVWNGLQHLITSPEGVVAVVAGGVGAVALHIAEPLGGKKDD